MAYTTIDKPSEHFNIKLTTGTGSSQAVTGLGFQPDWIWGKRRDSTGHPTMFDVIRGITKGLETNGTGQEFTSTDYYSSFDSDGFTIAAGSAGTGNGSSQTAVHWCWKAGGTASTNSNGSISASVSANPTAGFSIVSWTGDGSDATIGHGLSSAPKWIIHKHRSGTVQWNVYHKNAGIDGYLRIDGTNTWTSNTGFFGTLPTATVFSPGSHSYMSGTGNDNIAYCFADVKGYSKFGEYFGGNANANGPFVYLGFKPAFVLVRDSDNAENWLMYDNERPGRNLNNNHLFANTNDQETASTANTMDLLSNGFKIRSTNNGLNRSGGSFLYMAFAKHPFVSSTGTPTTAR